MGETALVHPGRSRHGHLHARHRCLVRQRWLRDVWRKVDHHINDLHLRHSILHHMGCLHQGAVQPVTAPSCQVVNATSHRFLQLGTIELQPFRSRAVAASVSQSSNWIVNTCVALTTPVFLSKSSSGPYLLFAACLCTFILPCGWILRRMAC